MKRTVPLAVASLATLGVGLAVAVPASASSHSHTLTFAAKEIKGHGFGKHFGAELDKDVHGGKIIALDELDFDGNTAQVAVALKGGFLYGHFVISKDGGTLSGKVTGGTGAYKGDSGTIDGTVGDKGAKVTIVYH